MRNLTRRQALEKVGKTVLGVALFGVGHQTQANVPERNVIPKRLTDFFERKDLHSNKKKHGIVTNGFVSEERFQEIDEELKSRFEKFKKYGGNRYLHHVPAKEPFPRIQLEKALKKEGRKILAGLPLERLISHHLELLDLERQIKEFVKTPVPEFKNTQEAFNKLLKYDASWQHSLQHFSEGWDYYTKLLEKVIRKKYPKYDPVDAELHTR